MKKYTHLLFDLDHTLWDFNTNCEITLKSLFIEYNLKNREVKFNDFFRNYLIINNEVWSLYDKNKITKEEIRVYRFKKLLDCFNIKDSKLALNLETKYLDTCPKMGHLLPCADELLNLVSKDYKLNLITNGFQETQELKVKHSKLNKYFNRMFTSESVGFKKPDVNYFNYVLDSLNVNANQCLVIGDNPHTDIKGANNAAIDSVWINTQKYPKTIKCTY